MKKVPPYGKMYYYEIVLSVTNQIFHFISIVVIIIVIIVHTNKLNVVHLLFCFPTKVCLKTILFPGKFYLNSGFTTLSIRVP